MAINAICNSIVPPAINTTEAETEYAGKINLTLGKAQPIEINYAVCNTFGFGGHIATVIFKKHIQ